MEPFNHNISVLPLCHCCGWPQTLMLSVRQGSCCLFASIPSSAERAKWEMCQPASSQMAFWWTSQGFKLSKNLGKSILNLRPFYAIKTWHVAIENRPGKKWFRLLRFTTYRENNSISDTPGTAAFRGCSYVGFTNWFSLCGSSSWSSRRESAWSLNKLDYCMLGHCHFKTWGRRRERDRGRFPELRDLFH